MTANTLIIAGMHRSGTSLISQWLNRCGLNLGETLLGPCEANEDGHFEDVDFYRFHLDALTANNLPSSGFLTKPVLSLSTYQKEKLKRIIDFKNDMHGQWGWKDPRTCLFLAHYRALLPGAYYLNIVRDYRSTVSSMIHRDFARYETKYLSRPWLSKQVWLKIRREKRRKQFYKERVDDYLSVWIAYNEQILKNIQTLPQDRFIVVDHQALLENDKDVFDQLKNKWHFELNYYEFKNIFKPNLLSRVVNIDEYITNGCLIKKAKRLEDMLRQHM